ALDERLWGTRALVEQSPAVLRVHQRYVEAGGDVICTNTWGLPSALLREPPPVWSAGPTAPPEGPARPPPFLARAAAAPPATAAPAARAVAFSINGDVDSEEGETTIRLLARLFAEEAPDLILLETLSLVRPSLLAVIERLLETELPVWLSFRRCRRGLCSVY